MSKNELPTSWFSKVIVRQTPWKLYTTTLGGWSIGGIIVPMGDSMRPSQRLTVELQGLTAKDGRSETRNAKCCGALA